MLALSRRRPRGGQRCDGHVNGGIKGKRKSKKDKLREAAAAAGGN
jgi:hypothetical protein